MLGWRVTILLNQTIAYTAHYNILTIFHQLIAFLCSINRT